MSESSHSSAPPGRDSRVGMLLSDRYRIDALVDHGAMGRVYVGEHVLMHKRVAIKVLHRELTVVPEFVARFEREAMAAANIDSEHVVAATDFGKLPDGAVFLVLEYIEGKNLRDDMLAGPMPLLRTLHIARQIGIALRTAHDLGIVHRDLKPENVMLIDKAGDPDFVKVLDFGIAKVPIGEVSATSGPMSRPITKAGMVFGTPEYMPPEQALGQSVDARADLYSLGVIIYEMLAGRRPFVAESQVGVLGQQISHAAPRISERSPGVLVPPAVERFVLKLLEREASHRPQTAQAVIDEIDLHLGYSPARQRIPTLREDSFGDAETMPPDDDNLPTRSLASIPPIAGLSNPFDRIGDWVDSHRGVLPPKLRALPAPVLFSAPLGILGLLIGFGVVFAFTAGHDGHAATAASAVPSSAPAAVAQPAAAPAAHDRPSDADLASATAGGSVALRALSVKYPNDAHLRVAIATADLKEKAPASAVEAVAQALALDPSMKDDAEVASAIWRLAQNKKSGARAFQLLEGPMGAHGVSILHDLTVTAGVRDAVKAEAHKVLARLGK